MSIAQWIFLGLIIITLGIWSISYIKKHNILNKICGALILPFSAALIIISLTKSLPDSYHIIVITSIAFVFLSLSAVFILFDNIKTLRILSSFTSIAGLFCWCILYEPIFRIHSIAAWIWILCSCLYGLALLSFYIFTKKQTLHFYLLFTITFAVTAFLNFCALIFLCFERTGASILLFVGASLTVALACYSFYSITKQNNKHAELLRYSLLVISQLLIACSNIIMIS